MAGDQNTSWANTSRTPDIRAAIRRQLPLIVALTLIGGLAGFGYSVTRDATYESKATVQLIATSSEQAPGGGLGRTLDVETQATVARATTLLTTVADRLGLTITQVRRSSQAEAAATGDILYLKFEAGTAEKAAEGATVYTEEYMAQRQAIVDQEVDEQRQLLEAQRDDLTAQRDDLTAQIAESSVDDPEYNVLVQSQTLAIRDLAAVRDSLASISNPDVPARVLVDPRTAVNKTGLQVPYTTLGGGLVGLLLGIILGLLRDRNDDRYGSAVDLDSIGIHETGRLRYVANPRSPQAGRVRSRRAAGVLAPAHQAQLLERPPVEHRTLGAPGRGRERVPAGRCCRPGGRGTGPGVGQARHRPRRVLCCLDCPRGRVVVLGDGAGSDRRAHQGE